MTSHGITKVQPRISGARAGLGDSDSFVRFVSRDLDFYARKALVIRGAARTPTAGWESVRYNEDWKWQPENGPLWPRENGPPDEVGRGESEPAAHRETSPRQLR